MTIEPNEMVSIATRFFEQLFTTSFTMHDMSHILSGVKHCISNEDNSILLALFTKEEAHEVVRDMVPTKASGLDGFSIIFYQRYCILWGRR